jgi:murein DD-endopeptidase MepM/ murein hydrolase activator NlpD
MSARRRRLTPTLPAWILLAAALTLAPPDAMGQEVVRRVGRVTIQADVTRAFPGGVLVVRLGFSGRLGAAWALLDGRRAPFHPGRGGLRALVPVAADSQAGPVTLGIGIAARRGEQRIAVPIEIAARAYPSRTVALPLPFQALIAQPEALRDARRLLALVRSESSSAGPDALRPPVAGPGGGFGELRSYPGFAELESRVDALTGERHRGVDYAVPVGTPVSATGTGTVVFAGMLVPSGGTVVIDHGQGIVSVLLHLSRIDVRAGQAVAAGSPIGLSGESGLTPAPLLQWRLYLHGVAVDPLVLDAVLRS